MVTGLSSDRPGSGQCQLSISTKTGALSSMDGWKALRPALSWLC